MSFGAFRRLPSQRSASTSIAPFLSVRATRRVRVSQVYRRPSASKALPAGPFASVRKTSISLPGVHFISRSPGVSLKIRIAFAGPGRAFGEPETSGEVIELDFGEVLRAEKKGEQQRGAGARIISRGSLFD